MIATSSRTSSGWTSGTGLAIAKTIAPAADPADRGGRHRAGPGKAEQHVGAGQRLLGRAAQPALVGVLGERRPLAVEILHAGMQRAAAVAHEEVADALGEHDLRAAHAGRTGADDHDRDVLGSLVDDPQGVEQRGEHDDRRAVLVVVEDRDVELRAQPPLDLKAARHGDVLEIDAAEGRGHRRDEGDDLVDVLGVDAQRQGVDASELLEQHRLALHHGHRRGGADVVEPEHGRPVGDDGPYCS
jgi:hypothetical protein